MKSTLRLCLLSSILWLTITIIPEGYAQVGPPVPEDTSAFRGNVYALLQQKPLPYEEQIYTLPLLSSSSASATLIQIREGVKKHYHAEHDEIVYVIRGKGVMTVGGETKAIQAGDVVLMKRGSVHEVTNKTAEPLVALSVISPPFDGRDRIFIE